MYVRVLAYLYPGVHLTGVAIVRVENGRVTEVAVGSVGNSVVSGLLRRVMPTEMIVSTDKFFNKNHAKVPVPDSVKRFVIARPGWEKSKVPLIIDGKRKHGVYVHNVYKMMFADLMARDVSISGWKLTKFDREWVMSVAPMEMGRAG